MITQEERLRDLGALLYPLEVQEQEPRLFETPSDDLVKCQLVSRVRLFAIPWAVAHQAPLSMGFSRQESWRGLPCPPPWDLPGPGGIKPARLASPVLTGRFFTTEPRGDALCYMLCPTGYFGLQIAVCASKPSLPALPSHHC